MVAPAFLGHKVWMADAPFSVKVSLDPLKEVARYRWTISDGEKILQVCGRTYESENQAHMAATRALRRINAQRRLKSPFG
jgi:hypothetical protein